MRSCLSKAALLVLAGATALPGANTGVPAHKLTLVVRADQRSGRLVRATLVSPRQVPALPVPPRVVEPRRAASATDLETFVEEIASRYDLDPALVRAVIEVESGYNPRAVSPKGATGLMQLMPATARRLGVRNSFDPRENVEGGVRYLKYLLELFNGDKRLALAAYNAGEGAVFRYGDIPPYPETTQYVYRVGKKLGESRRANQQAGGVSGRPGQPRLIEYVDSEGRWHIQTRLEP